MAPTLKNSVQQKQPSLLQTIPVTKYTISMKKKKVSTNELTNMTKLCICFVLKVKI